MKLLNIILFIILIPIYLGAEQSESNLEKRLEALESKIADMESSGNKIEFIEQKVNILNQQLTNIVSSNVLSKNQSVAKPSGKTAKEHAMDYCKGLGAKYDSMQANSETKTVIVICK